jgi:hypothetical protein
MSKKCLTVLLALSFVVGVISNLSSTTLLRKELPQLVQEAETIALGTISGRECGWFVADGGENLIYTVYTLQVEEIVKGDAQRETITFKVVGGTIGDLTLAVPSTPHYDTGERVIVLLGPAGAEWLSDVVGWTQGNFHVVDGIVVERNEPVESFLNLLANHAAMED